MFIRGKNLSGVKILFYEGEHFSSGLQMSLKVKQTLNKVQKQSQLIMTRQRNVIRVSLLFIRRQMFDQGENLIL